MSHPRVVLDWIGEFAHRIIDSPLMANVAACDGFAVEVGHLRRSFFQQSRQSFAPLTRGVNSFLQRSHLGRDDDSAFADPPSSCVFPARSRAAPASMRSLPKGDGPAGRIVVPPPASKK